MKKRQLKIYSICVPFSFFPIPKYILKFLYPRTIAPCSKEHVLIYSLTLPNQKKETKFFSTLEEAKDEYKKATKEDYKEIKITNITLELPIDWLSYFNNKEKPILKYPLDTDLEIKNEIENHKKKKIKALIELRNNFILNIKSDMDIEKKSTKSDMDIEEKSTKPEEPSIKKNKKFIF